jgi:hypothetical protein
MSQYMNSQDHDVQPDRLSLTDRWLMLGGAALATWGPIVGGVQMAMGDDPKKAFAAAAAGAAVSVITYATGTVHEAGSDKARSLFNFSPREI